MADPALLVYLKNRGISCEIHLSGETGEVNSEMLKMFRRFPLKRVREGFQELILQPQSDLPHFRHFLSEIGWEIVREEMIKEDGKFYPMMKAVRNKTGKKIMYTEAEAWFGPLLLEKCHPVLKEYLLREASIRKKILADLFSGAGTSSASAKDRLAEVKEEMELIKLALGRYESI